MPTRIDITGEICPDITDMFGTIPGTLSKIRAQMAAGPAPYEVHLYSRGGSYEEALACVSLLSEHECTVIVDSACYSAATLFLSLGPVTMKPGTLLMFHAPSSCAEGTSEDLTEAITYLENIKEAAAGLYAKKTGKTIDEMKALMDGETWLTPEKALEMGFAQTIDGPPVEAVAFAKFHAGMKVSDRAPDNVRLAADPVGFVAKLFGTEATAEAISSRCAEMRKASETVAQIDAQLLAETEAHKTTEAALKAAKDAVLRFDERVAKRVAELAASARVSPVEIKPKAAEENTPKGLFERYKAIQDAGERFAFFQQHSQTLMRFLGN